MLNLDPCRFYYKGINQKKQRDRKRGEKIREKGEREIEKRQKK